MIYLTFAGTNDLVDIEQDKKMGRDEIPKQYNEAVNFYRIIKENRKYWGYEIRSTGHSLGGSLAQMLGAIYNLKTVTFNAYGTRDLFKDEIKLHSENIVNYCNDEDVVTTVNAENHIGQCYLLRNFSTTSDVEVILKMARKSTIIKNFAIIREHMLELAKPLETRKPISKAELVSKSPKMKEIVENYAKNAEKKRNEEELKIQRASDKKDAEIKAKRAELEERSKHITTGSVNYRYRPSGGTHGGSSSGKSECAGTYQVSGYTRDDGVSVKSYMRTCGAKHEN